MATPLWQPTAEQIDNAQMTAFAKAMGDKYGADLAGYDALHAWSIEDPARFWSEWWDYAGVVSSHRWQRVLDHPTAMPGAAWFPGARLNFAENLLKYRDDQPAIIAWAEGIERRELSYAQLYKKVAEVAAALRAHGIEPGDRIANFTANTPEAIIIMLAASAVGATYSSCSPDFGVRGVLDRFGQIEPRILFAIDGYRYNGKPQDCRAKIAEIASQIASLEKVVIVPFLENAPDIAAIPQGQLLGDFIEPDVTDVAFEQLPFDHPLYVLYSSGTTGVPKAIVHGQGGTLLQHLKEHILHGDLRREDRLYFFTTCGWMMWNWLVSALAVGATVLLYEGSPFYPDGNVQFDMAEREGMTLFGTGAKFIDAIRKAELKPAQSHDLSKLRGMFSTGSPLVDEGFDYVYRDIKSDLQLASISGGTDIVSCFVLGCPILPVYRGEIQCRGLGLAVEVWNDSGQPVIGEKGELVCTKPFVAMPVSFWNDADGTRYRNAYFSRFDNIWTHGDYAELTERGGMIIYGRSDAVLNPGGVRIGTAEIYRQVEQIDEVVEAICVGQDWDDDVRVVLFVRLRPDVELDEALIKRIKTQIRDNCTPRHVPAKIVQIDDIPRTMSGKIAEIAVRDIIHGREVKNTEALANPQSLDMYRDLDELLS